jgi:hypothetical protein
LEGDDRRNKSVESILPTRVMGDCLKEVSGLRNIQQGNTYYEDIHNSATYDNDNAKKHRDKAEKHGRLSSPNCNWWKLIKPEELVGDDGYFHREIKPCLVEGIGCVADIGLEKLEDFCLLSFRVESINHHVEEASSYYDENSKVEMKIGNKYALYRKTYKSYRRSCLVLYIPDFRCYWVFFNHMDKDYPTPGRMEVSINGQIV